MRVVLDDEQDGIALLDLVAIVLDVLFARDRQDGAVSRAMRRMRSAADPRGRRAVGARSSAAAGRA